MTTKTVSTERPNNRPMGIISTRAETKAGVIVRAKRMNNTTLSKVVRVMSIVGRDLPFHEPTMENSELVSGGTDIFFALAIPDEELEYAIAEESENPLFAHLEKISGIDAKVFENKLDEIVANLWNKIYIEDEIHSAIHTFHVISTISL